MDYYVVFSEKFVQTIPVHWLNKDAKTYFWPPKKIKFTTQTMQNLQPDSSWSVHIFVKCLGPFNSLELAVQVEISCLSASTGDDSDALVNAATNSLSGGRKRHAPKPVYPTDTDSDEEFSGAMKRKQTPRNFNTQQDDKEDSDDLSGGEISKEIHARAQNAGKLTKDPPKCNSENIGKLSDNEPENGLNNDNANVAVTVKNPWTRPVSPVEIEFQDDNLEATTDGTAQNNSLLNAPKTLQSEGSGSKILPRIKTIQLVSSRHKNTSISSDQPLSENRYRAIYHTQILSKLNSINNRIIGSKKSGCNTKENQDFSLLPSFPIKTYEDLDSFDELLENAEILTQFKNFIENVGGKNEGDFVRSSIREIMTDTVVSSYTWSGQRNTEAIKNKNVAKIIIDTVSSSDKSYSKKACKEYFKNYVQHAHEGLKDRPSNARRSQNDS